MFRHRRNSQKPSRQFYDAFRLNYPNLGTSKPQASSSSLEAQLNLDRPSALEMAQRPFDHPDEARLQEGHFPDQDSWRLTPSLLDPNLQFPNLPPDQHFMADTLLHSKAGDLHTPNFSFQLGTPLTSGELIPSTTAIDHQGYNFNLAGQTHFATHDFSHQSFAPSAFVHRDSGYESVSLAQQASALSSAGDAGHLERKAIRQQAWTSNAVQMQSSTADNLRFYTTLNAPTAMIKQPDEIPISYLNKGQAYAISINDTLGSNLQPIPPRYRTVVRISFEDHEQRMKPASCWQLWKEGRGTAEAHQRGGRLQAVEFVESSQNDNETVARPRIDLEMASFDSFAVTWSPVAGSTDCSIGVRFNFLSTDFSHSKGVKGIPVRLCAKTQLLSSGTPDSRHGPISEVNYCKVKLFRDHGAERKLSNDVAHIKKTIEKVQQQLAQIEIGLKDGSKRKRSTDSKANPRPSKMPKHKRTWSVSSQTSNERPSLDDNLQQKLDDLQDMFTSTRPVSVLNLKGDEQDDPDAYPVALGGLSVKPQPQSPADRRDSASLVKQSSQSTPSKMTTPVSSTADVVPVTGDQHLHKDVLTTGFDHSSEWAHLTHLDKAPIDNSAITQVPRRATIGVIPPWIDAVDVDPSYEPKPRQTILPAACFYVRQSSDSADDPSHFRAIYLPDRTLRCLLDCLASKFPFERSQLTSVFWINKRSMKIVIDDDVVGEINEGQDMMIDIVPAEASTSIKPESQDGQTAGPHSHSQQPLEIRLHY